MNNIEMVHHLVLVITLLLLSILNILLHSIGCALLHSVSRTVRQKVQRIYLINLSISIILTNFAEVLKIVLRFVIDENEHGGDNDNTFRHYVWMVSYTGVSYVYYADMYFITIDRLVQMLLSQRYNAFWEERKAKILLTAAWVIGLLISCVVCLANKFKWFKWKYVCFTYVYPVLDCFFILLAFVTYVFIYRKTMNSKKKLSRFRTCIGPAIGSIPLALAHQKPIATTSKHSKDDHRKITPFPNLQLAQYTRKSTKYELLRNSVFYIPFLLITTFLVFMVTPDLVILFTRIFKNTPSILLQSCMISYALCNFIDGCVYIYFQRDVQKLLSRKIADMMRL